MNWTAATLLYPEEFSVKSDGAAANMGREYLIEAIPKFIFGLDLSMIGSDYIDLSDVKL